jgi:hypothetical protein
MQEPAADESGRAEQEDASPGPLAHG